MRYRNALLLAALAGCNTLPDLSREYPDQAFYVLSAPHPEVSLVEPLGASLTVATFTVAPVCDDTSFVYRLGPHEYQADFYERFFVHPAEGLADATREWLHQGHRFTAVVPDRSRLATDFRLDALVQDLHGDYQDPEAPLAVLTLQCFLTDLRTPAHALAWQDDFHEEVALAEPTPEGLAAAWSEALARILARLEGELAKAVVARG